MARTLWHSTVPWGPSSYSVLTRRVVPDIVREGHDVIVSTWYGLQGEPQRWPIRNKDNVTDVLILPNVDPTTYGNDTVLQSYQFHKCDVMISCMDVWVLNPQITSQMRFCPWLPVDHEPAPPPVVGALKTAAYPMVYSKWGVDVLAKSGVESHYVPCSAPADVFAPMPMAEARTQMGLPADCDMLVSIIAANKDPDDRKSWGEMLTAFAAFWQKHPNAYCYCHTNWMGPVKIAEITTRLGVAKNCLRPHPYQYMLGLEPEQFIRMIYCASDVLLNAAKSEGFGLPVLEAQMCGTPVIVADNSSMPELLFAGWKVPGQPHWTIGAESFRWTPFIAPMIDALEAAYDARGDELLRKRARDGAIEYDCPTVFDRYWRPALAEIEDIVSGTGGKLELVRF